MTTILTICYKIRYNTSILITNIFAVELIGIRWDVSHKKVAYQRSASFSHDLIRRQDRKLKS